MRSLALIPALWLVAASDVLPALQARSEPFALAVLRRDGLALPFATFTGRRWEKTWPPDAVRDVPISVSNIPKQWWGLDSPPERLVLWTEAGAGAEVTLTGILPLRLMCQPRFVLRTDYKATAPVPPPFERPYPKEGLLVAGDVRLRPIQSVEKNSQEWRQIEGLLDEEFNRRETQASQAFTSWRHPIGTRQRRLVPIVLEAAYRGESDDPGWTAYFVEAVRQFPARPEDKDGCGLATYASGWVMLGPKNRDRVRLSAWVTYCDRKGVSYMLPFGTLSANDRTYWIVQQSGFEGEWYEVVRPRSGVTEIPLSYHVGFCGDF